MSLRIVRRVFHRMFASDELWQKIFAWLMAALAIVGPLLCQLAGFHYAELPAIVQYFSTYVPSLIIFAVILFIALYQSEKELDAATACRIEFGGFERSDPSGVCRVIVHNPSSKILRNCKVKVSCEGGIRDLPMNLHCTHQDGGGPQDMCDIHGARDGRPGDWKFDLLRLEPGAVKLYGPINKRIEVQPGTYRLQLTISADESIPLVIWCELNVSPNGDPELKQISL